MFYEISSSYMNRMEWRTPALLWTFALRVICNHDSGILAMYLVVLFRFTSLSPGQPCACCPQCQWSIQRDMCKNYLYKTAKHNKLQIVCIILRTYCINICHLYTRCMKDALYNLSECSGSLMLVLYLIYILTHWGHVGLMCITFLYV